MLANIVTSGWDWTLFVVAILLFLAADLGVFHRKAHVVSFREALAWSALWFALALVFGVWIAPIMATGWTHVERDEFITGYIIELALSMDNVFVMAVIFSYFAVPLQLQHRVLFWGILGALIMRGVMIGLGAAVINEFNFFLYILGVVLLYTGIKMVLSKAEEDIHPEKNIFIRGARRFFPVSPGFDGSRFTTTMNGRFALTPLALVLVTVETTDLIFAVDSIPAIFGVTTNPFIVFTSNVFAILGLRSLYFVLAGAIAFFRYLKAGLSIVLCFIGVKMLIAKWVHIETKLSLIIVASIILTSILMSVAAAKVNEKREDVTAKDDDEDGANN
jgi:tellurite resistance protein TerC